MKESEGADRPGRFPEDEEQHGSAPDVGTASEETKQAGDKAFRTPPPEPQWPGRVPSEEEKEGVPSTDMDARSPLGVGTSESARAEEMASGRNAEPAEGADRPVGEATAEQSTGVGAHETAEEESPQMPPGDQAG
ncbi:hypothetical protein [Actinoallomurus sp. NPDC052274]|uniref:hypothetical protein n=1 Tax=Actinoallomurus sp. NPDC052274 TaxID=3155420 RepID=UPI003436552F